MVDSESGGGTPRQHYQPLAATVGHHPSRNSSEKSMDRMNSQWCLTVAVVTFLCAVSLIGLSEGWLEALGLGRHVVHDKDCSSPLFTHETLKLLHEEPIQRLSSSTKETGQDLLANFEASGIRFSQDANDYYIVFDNSFYIGKFSSELGFHHHRKDNSTNKLLPWPGKGPEEESGFEAITFNETSGTYLLVQEAVRFNESIMANVLEVSIDIETDEVKPLQSCRCDYHFASDNKGFEGAEVLEHPNGKSYLVALCEGNFCLAGKQGRKAGHGRLVVLERTVDPASGECVYETASVVAIPRYANFEDYSDVAFNGKYIAIVSQQTAAVWIGKYKLVPEKEGLLVLEEGSVFDFPRNDLCEAKYCNVEGIAWEDIDKIAVVSDKMKSKGKQHYRCWDKDQSLHAFAVNEKFLSGYAGPANNDDDDDDDEF